MYSHVGIVIGAVVSALLGLYVFVPDGGLRTFDYWISIWQPVVWEPPARFQFQLSAEEGGGIRLPPWLQKLKDEVEEAQLTQALLTQEVEKAERMQALRSSDKENTESHVGGSHQTCMAP